jgi:TupA-like ATPgrasp
LPDYKFFVFGGRVEFIQMDIDRFSDHRRAFYDRSWRKQEISLGYPKLESLIAEPPRHLAAMMNAAEALGAPFDFVRIDLYDLPEGPKFGEVTFSPNSGFEQFNPPEMDRLFGSLWQRAGELRSRTLSHAAADDDRT